ncbi:MAG: peptide-methionine (S)-S-oxide reductase [Flavobacteriaceae bacterium]|nr:peptide-methionine (S)-S-oxide reductase [Flavobacteriaceae bacterium]|tara:strand:- start:16263 stop:16778 length:516 start_codon:yes stop_codon:yes gene_type:complete
MNSKIYLAGGCFWCTEAIFTRVDGVKKVIPGYIGGNIKNPSYKEVCSGRTGHAEAISIEFDKNIISLDKLLLIFFQTHDPTQLNRQGNDFGTQYRSAVFYTDLKQKKITENIIKKLSQSIFKNKEIVTKIELAKDFFEAEKEHINYYDLNSNQPYCQLVINPKIQKLKSLI